MKKTSHTRGPWHVVEAKFSKNAMEVRADNRAICELYKHWDEKIELANARLIAAAPEMLEALRLIENEDIVVPANREIIKAAIAKATGKKECDDEDGDVMCSACDCWKATRAYCS